MLNTLLGNGPPQSNADHHESEGTNSLFIVFFLILTLMYLYMFSMLMCQ